MDFPVHCKYFMENYPEIHSKCDKLGKEIRNSVWWEDIIGKD